MTTPPASTPFRILCPRSHSLSHCCPRGRSGHWGCCGLACIRLPMTATASWRDRGPCHVSRSLARLWCLHQHRGVGRWIPIVADWPQEPRGRVSDCPCAPGLGATPQSFPAPGRSGGTRILGVNQPVEKCSQLLEEACPLLRTTRGIAVVRLCFPAEPTGPWDGLVPVSLGRWPGDTSSLLPLHARTSSAGSPRCRPFWVQILQRRTAWLWKGPGQ